MKNFLHTLPYFLLLLLFSFLNSGSVAQCTCSGGDPATPMTYYYKLDTSDISPTIISFPKFNPTVGILSCVTFNDTTSLVATSGVRNTGSVAGNFEFFLNVTNRISGPGIMINQAATRNYGPSLLTEYGTPGDTTSYGPDTLFQNRIHSSNSSSIAPYIGGSGTADFEYKVGGGGIATDGGLNYRYEVHSRFWGAFRLTYYWCPSLVLSSSIKNFSAVKKDGAVLLKWLTLNKTEGMKFRIEYSIDGRTYINIGEAADNGLNSIENEFHYAEAANNGNVYFRIRQVDAMGKVSYSPVRIVNMNEKSAAGFTIYPNPVSKNVSMQFDRSLNGNYMVEVTNVSGQVMFARSVQMKNESNIQFEMGNPPPSGVYYLKITDTKTKLSYSNKLIVRR